VSSVTAEPVAGSDTGAVTELSPQPSSAKTDGQETAATAPKLWGGSQPAIFTIQVFYLTILAVLATIYFTDRNMIGLPESIGPVSIAVPWFGALGAVLISLVGVTEHRNDWDPSYRFWHWSRPLLGASFGAISVLIFQAGILAVGSTPSAKPADIPHNLLYYIVAFAVGYRDETFRELMKRLTDVIFSQGPTTTGGLVASSLSPQSGPAAGGTLVTVLGSGLKDTDSVRFGAVPAKFHVDGDSQVTVTSPAGQPRTTVPITIAAKSGSAVAGTFTYLA
jgi:hypothetical protein